MAHLKVCTLCETEKAIGDFANDKQRKDGKHPRCKECANRLRRERRAGVVRRVVWQDTPTHKHCRLCGVLTKREEFSPSPNTRDGLETQCRVCRRKYDSQRRPAMRPRRIWEDTHDTKWCRRCERQHPLSNFSQSKASKDGRHYYCRMCMSRYGAYYRSRTVFRRARPAPSSFAAAIGNASSRARKSGGQRYVVSESDLAALLRRQSDRCSGCQHVLQDRHLDHIIPLSRGGSSGIGNYQWLCSRCNLSKGGKTMTEWKFWKSEVIPCI